MGYNDFNKVLKSFQDGGGKEAEIDKKIEDLKYDKGAVPGGKAGDRKYDRIIKKIDKLKKKKSKL